MDGRYQSWGRYPRAIQDAVGVRWRHADLPLEGLEDRTFLPYGNGRSYGDSCLNDGGVLLDMRGLDRFIRLDAASGILRCEAGVMLSDVLDLIVPRGWFLPVTPGTKLVTLGGAIANDVHGKNHHRAGTFGCHVRSFLLLRSDGTRTVCSPEQNAELFRATIGGLGLTGTILWAELALRPVSGPFVDSEVIRFGSLDEFFPLSEEADRTFDYTVAWIDGLARGKALGRGLFMGGNHSDEEARGRTVSRKCRFRFRVEPPVSLVNRVTSRILNAFHYRRHVRRKRRKTVHYEAFFHPLDALGQWNRVYGPKGFLQYQCVLPHGPGRSALSEIFRRITESGPGASLAVLKVFGEKPSPGLLSFPRPGITLALDFPNRGRRTLDLLDRLDEVVRHAGGALYPAKDARMSGEDFRRAFKDWRTVQQLKDPRFSSSFWRRVTEGCA
jgi:FAD/FMN-containing dehydrogenase